MEWSGQGRAGEGEQGEGGEGKKGWPGSVRYLFDALLEVVGLSSETQPRNQLKTTQNLRDRMAGNYQGWRGSAVTDTLQSLVWPYKKNCLVFCGLLKMNRTKPKTLPTVKNRSYREA